MSGFLWFVSGFLSAFAVSAVVVYVLIVSAPHVDEEGF